MKRNITLTENRINKLKTLKGGYNKKTLNALGIDWPLKKGWKKNIIGKSITLGSYIDAIYKSENKALISEVTAILPTLIPPVEELTISQIRSAL